MSSFPSRPASSAALVTTAPPAFTELLDQLYYRYPSVLLDGVIEHEPGVRLLAVKNVTVNEEFFQGHFPGTPLMPGVLMIEALLQAAIRSAHGVAKCKQRTVSPAGRAW